MKHIYSVLIVVLILHAALMAFLYEPACTGADANGYLAQTQYLLHQGETTHWIESPLQFIGPHWLQLKGGWAASRYPPGLAVLFIPFYWLGGVPLTLAFNPLLTTLTLCGLFFLCRLWASDSWALLAVAVTAVNPVANTWAFQADSHPAIAFFLVWGVYFLVSWARNGKPWAALAAGLLLGVIPTLHYAEAIFAPAIVFYLFAHWKNERRYFVSLALAAIGGSIPALLMVLHNVFVFGSIFKTGYTLSGDVSLFGIWYFLQKILLYPALATFVGIGPFFGLGLLGMAAAVRYGRSSISISEGRWYSRPFRRLLHFVRNDSMQRVTQSQTNNNEDAAGVRKFGILLLGLTIPLLLLYTAYFFTDPSQRFLLPTFYLYVVASVWLLSRFYNRNPRFMKKAVVVLVALNTVAGIVMTLFFAGPQKYLNAQLATIVRSVEERVEPDAIIIAPMLVNQHLESMGKWKLADENYFLGKSDDGPPAPGLDSEIMQSLFQMDIKAKRMDRYWKSGDKTLSRELLSDLDRWAGGEGSIYWIGEKDAILDRIPEGDRAEVVAEIAVGHILELPGSPGFEGDGNERRPGGPQFQRPLGTLPGEDGGSAVVVKWDRKECRP